MNWNWEEQTPTIVRGTRYGIQVHNRFNGDPMADDPEQLALSMMNMYGAQAEQEARNYADQHRRKSDEANIKLWLSVANVIARHNAPHTDR